MLFMLKIIVNLPPQMPQADKDALRERENARATELIGQGTMVRIWRIVGRVANFSVWHANTLEDLHAVLMTLPMFPYMEIDVTPLIDHPVTQVAEARNGPRAA
jgi:muconolactone D-isomerase